MDKIILLAYISVASSVSAFVTPALPEIEHYFHMRQGQSHWVVSIFLLGYTLGQMVYGPLANAVGRVRALQLGLSLHLFGIVVSLAAIPFSYAGLLFGRFISALGASAGLVCTIILINEGNSKQTAKQLLSYAIISFMMGIKLSVLIGGLITSYFGWQFCFVFLVFHALCMLALSCRLHETLQQPARKFPDLHDLFSGYKTALTSGKLVSFSLVLALATVISYSYTTFGPLIGRFRLHLSASDYGFWNLLNAFGMLAGALLSKQLFRLYKPIYIIIIGLICVYCCMFSLFAMLLYDSQIAAWFFLTTVFLYLGLGLVYPAASFYASNAIACKAHASSAMNFVNMGSGTLVVTCMGLLPWDPLVTFICSITGFTLFVTLLTVLQYSSCVTVHKNKHAL